MARRYLNIHEATLIPSHAKTIECFIGSGTVNGHPMLGWLEGIEVNRFDNGSEDNLEIYSFESVDPDRDPSEKRLYTDIETALEGPESEHHGVSNRLVNAGAIQDEYSNHLRHSSE